MSCRKRIKEIFYFIVLSLFIFPSGIEYISGIDILFDFFALGRYITSIFYIFRTAGNPKIRHLVWKKPTVLIAVMSAIMILSSFANGTARITLIMSYITYLGFWCFTSYCFVIYKLSKPFLITCRFYLSLMLCIQFCTVILFPKGIIVNRVGAIHWLGGKNGVSLYALLLILVLFIEGANNQKLLAVTFLLTCLMIMQNTFSGLGAMLIVLIYLLSQRIKNYGRNTKLKKTLLRIMIALLVVFFIFIVIGGKNLGAISLLTSFIGKDFTFSGRRAIWEAAINNIKNNPLFGIGQGALYDVWNNSKYVYSAHNTILDTAVAYGLITLVVFMSIITTIIKKIFRENKENLSSNRIIVIICVLLVMIFEAIEMDYMMWAILSCAYWNCQCRTVIKKRIDLLKKDNSASYSYRSL